MPRRPLHVLTLASAVICIGSLLLVVRSIFRMDVVDGGHWWVATIDGHVIIYAETPARPRPLSYFGQAAAPFRKVRERLMLNRRWAIGWLRIGWVDLNGVRVVILPFWPVTILTVILPVRWWCRRRSRANTRGFAVVEATAEPT